MNNNENSRDEWESPPGQMNKASKQSLQNFGISEEDDDSNRNFMLKVPEEINKRINKRSEKKTLKEQVEIGKLQVEHIKNANVFYDEAFKLQTKEKKHELDSLDLDHKIQAKRTDIADHVQQQKLKALRNEADQLTLEIDIAEKQARLNQLRNPPKQEKSEPSLKEKIERVELDISKLRRERLGALIEILNNREYEELSEDEQQRYDETSIDYDSRIHSLKEKIEKLRAKAG